MKKSFIGYNFKREENEDENGFIRKIQGSYYVLFLSEILNPLYKVSADFGADLVMAERFLKFMTSKQDSPSNE